MGLMNCETKFVFMDVTDELCVVEASYETDRLLTRPSREMTISRMQLGLSKKTERQRREERRGGACHRSRFSRWSH